MLSNCLMKAKKSSVPSNFNLVQGVDRGTLVVAASVHSDRIAHRSVALTAVEEAPTWVTDLLNVGEHTSGQSHR